MKCNGMGVLDFHTPALVRRQFTYLSGRQFIGQLVALCFLPYAGLVAAHRLDHYGRQFQQIDTTLLIAISGPRPFHRLWISPTEKPSTTLLADPCGRLHRRFGVGSIEAAPHCRTFVIDQDGILRLRVTHDFVDGDLDALRNILERKSVINNATGTREVTVDTKTGIFPGLV